MSFWLGKYQRYNAQEETQPSTKNLEFNDWHRKGTPPSYARYTRTTMLLHPQNQR